MSPSLYSTKEPSSLYPGWARGRQTGWLRGDLEAATLEYLELQREHRDWTERSPFVGIPDMKQMHLEAAAREWNLHPQALACYWAYQDLGAWLGA